MIVDDEEEILNLLGETFRLYDYEPICVRSGTECLAVLHGEDKRPDLIIMDIAMEEMDGWETVSRIKDDPITASIPIVILTAYPMTHRNLKVELLDQVEDYVTKPFSLDRLMRSIESILNASKPLPGPGGIFDSMGKEEKLAHLALLEVAVKRHSDMIDMLEKDDLIMQLREDELYGRFYKLEGKVLRLCQEKLEEIREELSLELGR